MIPKGKGETRSTGKMRRARSFRMISDLMEPWGSNKMVRLNPINSLPFPNRKGKAPLLIYMEDLKVPKWRRITSLVRSMATLPCQCQFVLLKDVVQGTDPKAHVLKAGIHVLDPKVRLLSFEVHPLALRAQLLLLNAITQVIATSTIPAVKDDVLATTPSISTMIMSATGSMMPRLIRTSMRCLLILPRLRLPSTMTPSPPCEGSPYGPSGHVTCSWHAASGYSSVLASPFFALLKG